MSHVITFDFANLVMSETRMPKKFRLNYFLKKSHCAQIARYFCSRRHHRKRYRKREWIHVNVNSILVTFLSDQGGGVTANLPFLAGGTKVILL